MILLGQSNTLTANRTTDNGMYLIDDEENEVLLPNKYVPDNLKAGKEIEVFVYKDSEDRPVATTIFPKVMLYGYAYLEAKDVSSFGAFFDWGLEKDLLVPIQQQAKKIHPGEFHVVYVYLDEKSDRIAGSTKIKNSLEKNEVDLQIGEEVNIIPFESNEIGFHCIVNEFYQGMLFRNEVFSDIEIGKELKGFIKKIRDDKKVDLSLNRFGYRAVEDNVSTVYNAMEENGGSLSLTDKSSPEEIYQRLGISKKLFKKAIGSLYKERIIEIGKDSISIIKKL